MELLLRFGGSYGGGGGISREYVFWRGLLGRCFFGEVFVGEVKMESEMESIKSLNTITEFIKSLKNFNLQKRNLYQDSVSFTASFS